LQIVNVETGSPSVLREIARAHTAHGGLRETPQLPPLSGTDTAENTFCEQHEEKPFGQKGEHFIQ